MPRSAPFDHRLVIRACQKKRPQAARIHLLQLQFFLRRDAERASGPGFIDSFTICPRGERDVIGVLVAAFNLERGDAGRDDLRNLAQRVEIAGRQQIARVLQRLDAPVHQQFVRQAAGLRALPAIGASASPGFRRKTLARVGHAQRSVDEDLQVAVGFRGDRADLIHRQLARQRHAVDAQAPRQFDSAHVGDAHLRAAVKLHARSDFARQAHRRQILDDQSVGARLGNGGDRAARRPSAHVRTAAY